MSAALETPGRRSAVSADVGVGWRVGAFVGTLLVIIALAVLPLLTPPFIHPLLGSAGSAERLGITTTQAEELSDRSVAELVLGGSFAFAAPGGDPFYDLDERAHLADARLLLWLFLAGGVLGTLVVILALRRGAPRARRALWVVIGRAGATAAIAVIALGLVSLVAFDRLFTLFHEVFFPGGNWAFDASSQRLVQLYPFAFWQLAAAALGLLIVVLGTLTWWLSRLAARRGLPD